MHLVCHTASASSQVIIFWGTRSACMCSLLPASSWTQKSWCPPSLCNWLCCCLHVISGVSVGLQWVWSAVLACGSCNMLSMLHKLCGLGGVHSALHASANSFFHSVLVTLLILRQLPPAAALAVLFECSLPHRQASMARHDCHLLLSLISDAMLVTPAGLLQRLRELL
jgi:hypothetical protein